MNSTIFIAGLVPDCGIKFLQLEDYVYNGKMIIIAYLSDIR